MMAYLWNREPTNIQQGNVWRMGNTQVFPSLVSGHMLIMSGSILPCFRTLYIFQCPMTILDNYSLWLMYHCCRHPMRLWGNIFTMDTELVLKSRFSFQFLLLSPGWLDAFESQDPKNKNSPRYYSLSSALSN